MIQVKMKIKNKKKFLESEDYFLIIKTKIPLFEGKYKEQKI